MTTTSGDTTELAKTENNKEWVLVASSVELRVAIHLCEVVQHPSDGRGHWWCLRYMRPSCMKASLVCHVLNIHLLSLWCYKAVAATDSSRSGRLLSRAAVVVCKVEVVVALLVGWVAQHPKGRPNVSGLLRLTRPLPLLRLPLSCLLLPPAASPADHLPLWHIVACSVVGAVVASEAVPLCPCHLYNLSLLLSLFLCPVFKAASIHVPRIPVLGAEEERFLNELVIKARHV